MTESWPRNITPVDVARLRHLATPAAIRIYLTALDRAVAEQELADVARVPTADATHAALGLVEGGFLRHEAGLYLAGTRHLREVDLDEPGKLAFRTAVLDVAEGILADFRRALHIMGEDAKVGIGCVTIPETPAAIAAAATLLAETEDQLRVIAEDHADDRAPTMRILTLIGTPTPHAFSKTPQ